jgi:hypothetical protein
MAKLDVIKANIAAKNPKLTQAQIDKRAQTRWDKQHPLAASNKAMAKADPLAQGAAQVFSDIQNIGGGSNGNLQSILSMIGGGGSYSPMSYSPVGGVRDIGSDAVNINLGGLRNALSENAKYALGQNLGALDARVAQGGLPGSSRHGIAQANTIADSDRNLQSTLAEANYQAYDADAARRLAAAQSNQSGDIATMNANAGLQGQTIGANANLQAAAMNDATNRLGVAGNIANNQADIALRRNQMLVNALGTAYDRSMGIQALNNQAMTDLSGQRYNYNTALMNNQYDLMNNQQDRALANNQYTNNALMQLLAGQNDTMNQGVYNTGNMQGSASGALSPYSTIQDVVNILGGMAPVILNQSSGNSQGWSRGGSSGFGMDSGASCGMCYIFMEARYDNGVLDEVVRRYRDEAVTPRRKRGYYKLSEVLVPLMRKYKPLKWLVRKTMVDPLVSYGKYHYGKGKLGVIFTPVKDFWMKMFDYLGQDHEFIRENGEVV